VNNPAYPRGRSYLKALRNKMGKQINMITEMINPGFFRTLKISFTFECNNEKKSFFSILLINNKWSIEI
jgi:hypothetical protein